MSERMSRQIRRAHFARRARRAATAAAGVLMTLTALMGFLHTKTGRPLMARIFGASCPMWSATPEAVDRARRMGVAAELGTVRAPARPALGFRLDATTKKEVQNWAKTMHLSCDDDHPWLLQCHDVDPVLLGQSSMLGRIEELSFGFRPDGRLTTVTTLRRHLQAEQAMRIAETIATGLRAELGRDKPSTGDGKVTEAPLSSLHMSLRYTDYFADVLAMNLPTTGVALREQYLSATD